MKQAKRFWLMSLRKKENLTHVQVAEKAGIERSTYTKAENGFPVSVGTAKAISRVFKREYYGFSNHSFK